MHPSLSETEECFTSPNETQPVFSMVRVKVDAFTSVSRKLSLAPMWGIGMNTLMSFSHFEQELWADVKDLPILKRIYYKLDDMISLAIFLATIMAVAYTRI